MAARHRFITSQGDTAPKRRVVRIPRYGRFITSQGDTAPKRNVYDRFSIVSFITSQGDTAPKPRSVGCVLD